MHRARKRFGQNFLVDPTIIQSLVSAIAPKSDDNILEIGPGLGALTTPLLSKLNHLEVVELDRDLIQQLQKLNSADKTIIVHQHDALKFDFSRSESPRRIVGNLPYNISTPLIFHLLDNLPSIVDMHFMLQKEVVDRICAPSGSRDFGRLSAMVQSKCSAQALIDVPAQSFSPAPKVMSAFIRLTPHRKAIVAAELESNYKAIVQQCFSQPRKTLVNNLKKTFTADEIISAGIDPTMRPQQLTINNLLTLAEIDQKHS
ncbi:MAG: 16S rRNA (adenine(1518)-N(6)/adenine(1519)-N(6))-dimethyltransferase RsmA [Gammaproteobacteria bacterium]|nr:16S rRNA (adenine(1518)-N(6)/adenine(1519)-N(6))-dimethyltransferase RsmA [Gammaproteobacteria bacterium]